MCLSKQCSLAILSHDCYLRYELLQLWQAAICLPDAGEWVHDSLFQGGFQQWGVQLATGHHCSLSFQEADLHRAEQVEPSRRPEREPEGSLKGVCGEPVGNPHKLGAHRTATGWPAGSPKAAQREPVGSTQGAYRDVIGSTGSIQRACREHTGRYKEPEQNFIAKPAEP